VSRSAWPRQHDCALLTPAILTKSYRAAKEIRAELIFDPSVGIRLDRCSQRADARPATAGRSACRLERARRFSLAVSAGVLTSTLACLSAFAQTTSDPSRTEESAVDEPGRLLIRDIEEFATAPTRWRRQEWVQFGAVVAAVGTAYSYDNRVRSHFVSQPEARPAVRDYENPQDAAPALLVLGGTWLAANLTKNADGRREAAAMLRSAIFAATSAEVLKAAFGRERPGPGAPRDSWRNGGGRSFPSGHTALASAIGTVLAESGDGHRWLRRTLGYGLAVATAYARVSHDSHWLSDTVAGAGLGIATGRFVMNRRDRLDPGGVFSVAPSKVGAMLTYTIPMRE
jgi:membrane-associated phospholipid phosphatase